MYKRQVYVNTTGHEIVNNQVGAYYKPITEIAIDRLFYIVDAQLFSNIAEIPSKLSDKI